MGKRKQQLRRAFDAGELTDVTVLYGNRRVVIRGCRKILSYAPEKICIALRRRRICLMGKELRFSSFAAGSAAVEGEICSIVLENRGVEGEQV